MRLQDLGTNFIAMSDVEQLAFFESYRNRRYTDLIETVTIKPKSKLKAGVKSEKKVTVTSEGYELLKKLGLL